MVWVVNHSIKQLIKQSIAPVLFIACTNFLLCVSFEISMCYDHCLVSLFDHIHAFTDSVKLFRI